jgi:DMSO/TMAO reductase YedYZ molybdopterin-dependent catalytic subunit
VTDSNRRPAGPDRRVVLGWLSGGLAARWLTGCDRLVVLEDPGGAQLQPITPNDRFYVYQYQEIPAIDPERHVVSVSVEGAEVATFDRAFLDGLPAREREHTLECVGARPGLQNLGNAVWGGLPLGEVLAALGVAVPPDAVDLAMFGADDYHAGIPVTDLVSGPVWLVWRMNGEPLPLAHGAPARVLVPGRYGMKNLKWPRELRFVREPHASFWTQFGWSEPAPYRPNTFVVQPPDGLEVVPDTVVRFVGTAFAGEDVIARVEVSIDGGPWADAELDYATEQPGVWVLWSFRWRVPAGDHVVQARCTTTSGARSHPTSEGTAPLEGYDGSMAIRVRA